MTKYEVQLFNKTTKQWICYNFTEDIDIANENASLLNSRGFDARITPYEKLSEKVEEFYIKKEVQ